MAAQTSSRLPTVPELMKTVKQLAPAELIEFKRCFAKWQEDNGGPDEEQSALLEACRMRLPAAAERRLNKLIARSERGELSSGELETYRALVRQTERIDAVRLSALTQLARRWGKPVHVVMATIGWEGGEDETPSRPAHPATARARPRR